MDNPNPQERLRLGLSSSLSGRMFEIKLWSSGILGAIALMLVYGFYVSSQSGATTASDLGQVKATEIRIESISSIFENKLSILLTSSAIENDVFTRLNAEVIGDVKQAILAKNKLMAGRSTDGLSVELAMFSQDPYRPQNWKESEGFHNVVFSPPASCIEAFTFTSKRDISDYMFTTDWMITASSTSFPRYTIFQS